MRCEPPPKCRTRQDRDRNKRLWPQIPCLVCRASHMLQLWLVCLVPLSENHLRTTLSELHWLNTFCCTWQLGTFLFPLGSQSWLLQAAEIDRGRHLLRMDKISRLTMLTFCLWPRQLDTVSHPLTALKSIYAFSLTFLTISWIAICR